MSKASWNKMQNDNLEQYYVKLSENTEADELHHLIKQQHMSFEGKLENLNAKYSP